MQLNQMHHLQTGHACNQTSAFSTTLNGISYDVHLNKGKGVPLPSPSGDALFMHGILGSKRNWRTPAKLLTQLAPELRVLAIDHRGHGSSHGLAGPNTLLSKCTQALSCLVAGVLIVRCQWCVDVAGAGSAVRCAGAG